MSSDPERASISDSEVDKIVEELDLLSKKWSIDVIKALMTENTLSFKNLRNCLDGVSNKILSERLNQLKHKGVIEKTEKKYILTEKGENVRSVFKAILDWKNEHDN